jgi:hypothetical protein
MKKKKMRGGRGCSRRWTTNLATPALTEREVIDYKCSMITDEDPLRALLFH